MRSGMPAPGWDTGSLRGARSIQAANPVRCAWGLFTGRALLPCSSPIPVRMLLPSGSMMISSTGNSHCPCMRAASLPDNCCGRRDSGSSLPGRPIQVRYGIEQHSDFLSRPPAVMEENQEQHEYHGGNAGRHIPDRRPVRLALRPFNAGIITIDLARDH